jgi:hypothetical protein
VTRRYVRPEAPKNMMMHICNWKWYNQGQANPTREDYDETTPPPAAPPPPEP